MLMQRYEPVSIATWLTNPLLKLICSILLVVKGG